MPISMDVRDERLTELVALDRELETVTTGFEFIEGPVWHPVERSLIFSDIVGNKMHRWTAEAHLETFRSPSNMANGNAYDREWRVLTCEHATSRVTRTERNGEVRVLASHFEGKELNSPNDIVVHSDGSIYFTDPNFGRRVRVGVLRDQEQTCQAVYRLDPNSGRLTRVADDFGNPNGLCLSLDESQLYVNDSPRGHIRSFDVKEDGALSGGALWAELRGAGKGVPDGMKFDAVGNLYCAGPGGIHVFAPGATCLGVIQIPEQAANFCWGGEDLRDLFVTASTTLYRLRMQVAGRNG